MNCGKTYLDQSLEELETAVINPLCYGGDTIFEKFWRTGYWAFQGMLYSVRTEVVVPNQAGSINARDEGVQIDPFLECFECGLVRLGLCDMSVFRLLVGMV